MAYKFHRADVSRFLEELTAEDLKQWHEYDARKREEDNYKLGLILSAIYNQARTDKKDKIFEPKDFFNFEYLQVEEKEQSIETQESYMAFIAQAVNAKYKQK